jgi:hypothetical protein
MKKLAVATLTMLVALVSQAATAHVHDKCSQCGGCEQIRKVCKAVPETKKVKSTVWSCKCEEICIPGRTLTHDCQPTCGRPRNVTKLVKKEVTKEVPGYKWVTTYVCGKCCDAASEVPAPTPAK